MTEPTAIPAYAAPVAIPVTRPPFGYVVNEGPDPGPRKNGLFIDIGLPGGVVHTVQVDTGSLGFVIPEALLLETDGSLKPGVTCLGQGEINYHPSSNSLRGCFYLVEGIGLGLTSPPGAEPAFAAKTGPIVVLGARYKGDTGDTPVGIDQGMMGVGFGRPCLGRVINGDVYQMGNPFLDAYAPGGAPLYPSYLMAKTVPHITLGVEPAGFKGDYPQASLIPLQSGTAADPANKDWSDTPTCLAGGAIPPAPPRPPYWNDLSGAVTISGVHGGQPFPVGLLLDTGLDLMMLRVDGIDGWSANLVGATVAVGCPEAGAPMRYQFSLAKTATQDGATVYVPAPGTAEAPSVLMPLSGPAAPTDKIGPDGVGGYVNTGINPIQGFAYYFDAKVGQVGFSPYPA